MASDACSDLEKEGQCLPCKCLGSSDKVRETNKEVVEPSNSNVAEKIGSLGPNTPIATRELGDVPYDCSSPLTAIKELPKLPNSESLIKVSVKQLSTTDESSPRTPEDGVFDPFAHGPDELAMAPLCKKYVAEMRACVARNLNFDSCIKFELNEDAEDSISDEELCQSVYENLLEVIITSQAEALASEISNTNRDSNGCKTPLMEVCNRGIADTCPGAPMKRPGNVRSIDLGLCRKLDFSQ